MTVSEQIIQVIDALCEKFGIAVNWTSENVIPYLEALCRKLAVYEICTSIAWMIVVLLLSAGSIIAANKLTPIFKTKIKEDDDYEIGAGFAIAGLIFLNLITFIVIVVQSMDIIKCVTFPEMYIFEYISMLIQQ